MWLYDYKIFTLFLGIFFGDIWSEIEKCVWVFLLDEIIPGNQKDISNGRDLIKSTWQPNEKKKFAVEKWECQAEKQKGNIIT